MYSLSCLHCNVVYTGPSSTCQPTLTLSLSDPLCCLVHLTGGKGSQLARLQTVSTKEVVSCFVTLYQHAIISASDGLSSQFTVPTGFCVTTHALDQHVKVCTLVACHVVACHVCLSSKSELIPP